jgi:DNA-binding transcriptional ArsR family regulator
MSENAPTAEERSAEAAFESVADETRLAVLRTLVEADDPLSFSELRERTGVDDSGRFNYHLKALRDGFVRQTDDGTYTVTHAGHSIVGAVLAGRLTGGGAVDPRQVDGSCIACGADLEARYDDVYFIVTCTECSQDLVRSPIPPAVIEDHEGEYPRAAWRYIFVGAAQMRAGFCHLCEGPIQTEIVDPGDTFPEDEDLAVNWVCDRCGAGLRSSIIAGLAHDTAVRSFLADHGIDPSTHPPWERPWLYEDAETTVIAEDPRRIQASIRLGDERLVVTVDDNVDVLDIERTTTE